MLFKKAKQLFVDVTKFEAYAARVKFVGGHMHLEGFFEVEIGEDIGEAGRALKEFAQSKKKKIASVCSVHLSSSFARRVTLELPSRARDPEFLGKYMKDEYRVQLDKNYYRVLNGSDGEIFDVEKGLQRNLVVCGARKPEVEECQQHLLRMGLYPDRLELGVMGTAAGVIQYTQLIKETEPVMVIEVGNVVSHISVIHRGQLEMARSIIFGVQGMLPIIQVRLGLDDEKSAKELFFSKTFDFTAKASLILDPIFRQLQLALDYYEVQRGQGVGKVLVTGLPESLKWIDGAIQGHADKQLMEIDYKEWAKLTEIVLEGDVDPETLDNRWVNIFGMLSAESVRH